MPKIKIKSTGEERTVSQADYDMFKRSAGAANFEFLSDGNASTNQKATLYGPNGQKEVVDVGSQRASELQSQGWGLTPGSYKPPVTAATTQKATLYGPNGQKEVVEVGSQRASDLQSQGWGLTEGSYRAPTTATPTPTPPSADITNTINSQIDEWTNSGELSEAEALLLKEIAKGEYTSGQAVLSPEELQRIIQDAETNARTSLEPYYNMMSADTLESLKQQMEDIRQATARYVQNETIDYRQKVQDTKSSLAARGLTFGGRGRKILGAEGALESAGVEGQMPTARRMGYEDYQATQNIATRNLGQSAEKILGTDALRGIDLGSYQTPYGTQTLYQSQGGYLDTSGKRVPYTGTLSLERQREIEKLKQENIAKARLYNQ